MSSYQYRKSHCGDKTILRPSYLNNGISYTSKTTSLYWIGALATVMYSSPYGYHISSLHICNMPCLVCTLQLWKPSLTIMVPVLIFLLSACMWYLMQALLGTFQSIQHINTMRSRQNCRHFADNIFKHVYLHQIVLSWIKFQWKSFLMAQLRIDQRWFRYWLALSHLHSILSLLQEAVHLVEILLGFHMR